MDSILADMDKNRLKYGLLKAIFANEENLRILVGFVIVIIILGLLVAAKIVAANYTYP